jgi:hypothetical protein
VTFCFPARKLIRADIENLVHPGDEILKQLTQSPDALTSLRLKFLEAVASKQHEVLVGHLVCKMSHFEIANPTHRIHVHLI